MSNSPFIYGPGPAAANLTNTVVVGANDGGTSTTTSTVRAPAVVGTNVTGSDLIIQSGNGTGSGGSGNIIFKTAPAITSTVPSVNNPQQTFNTNANSQTLSYGVPAGSSEMLVVTVNQQNTGTVSGITYGGVALTQLNTIASSGNRLDVWYLLAPTVGTANIIVSFSGNTSATVQAYTMMGVNQTTPFGTPAYTTTNGTSVSLTPSTSVGQTVLDFLGLGSTSSGATTTAGQTPIQYEVSGTQVETLQDYKTATAGTTTMSYALAPAPGNLIYIAVGVNGTGGTGADIVTEVVRVAASGAIGLSGANYGSTGQPLVSQGSNAAPVWGATNLLLGNNQILSANGPKNYIGNSSFQVGTTAGWSLGTTGTLVNGLPTGTPTFGSGASSNLSISAVTAGTLGGTYSLQMANTTAATIAGNMMAYQANIDLEDQAKVLTIKGYYSVSVNGLAAGGLAGAAATNNLAFAVYDATNSSWLSSAGNFNFVQSTGVGYFTGTCQTNATTSSLYFVVYFPNATSSATTFLFKDFYVGPQTAPSGPAMTDWVSTTSITTAGFGTISGLRYSSRRVGGNLEVQGTFIPGTSTSATAQIGVAYNGAPLTVDTSITGANNLVGFAGVNESGSNIFSWSILAPSSNASYVQVGIQTSGSSSLTTGTGVNVAGSNQIEFAFSVPIVGWSSNTSMSSDTDTRVIAMQVNSTPTATISTTASLVKFTSGVQQDTAGGFSTSTGLYTVPVTGFYRCSINLNVSGTYTTGGYTAVLLFKNGVQTAVNYTVGTTGDTSICVNLIYTVYCNAGDTLAPYIQASTVSPTIGTVFGQVNFFNVERLSGPAVIAATESVNAGASNTSGQSINSGSATIITGWTKQFDSHNAFSTSGVYTCPVSGKYLISGTIQFASGSNNIGAEASFLVTQAGSLSRNIRVGTFWSQTTSSTPIATSGAQTFNCQAGDTLTLYAFQASGSSKNLVATDVSYNNISIERVGN